MSYSDSTSNAGFRLIDYASDPYHEDEWFNWNLLDGLLTLNQPAVPYANATGTGAAWVVDYPVDQTLAVGLTISFKVPVANTGAVTLAVDGQAAKPIKINGSNPAANSLPTGMYVRAVYDGTNFNVVYPSFTTLGSNIITVGASGATPDPNADDFVVENSANIGFSMLSPNGTTGRFYFGSVAKPDAGGFVYDHGANRLYLRANQVNGPYVDQDKVLRQPDRPFAHATKTLAATASLANGTVFIFDTEILDAIGSYDPTTGIFTAPIGGTYEMLIDMDVIGSVAVNHVMGLYVNTTQQLTIYMAVDTVKHLVRPYIFFFNLAAGDTVSVKMVTNGGASNLTGVCRLVIRM